MKKDIMVAGLTLLICLGSGAVLNAQDAKVDANNKKTRTVTGCLRAGDHNVFKLDAQDGRMWELRSDSVKLAPQLGHTVAVTGRTVSQGENGQQPKPGHITVTKLVVVSEGCQTDIPMHQ